MADYLDRTIDHRYRSLRTMTEKHARAYSYKRNIAVSQICSSGTSRKNDHDSNSNSNSNSAMFMLETKHNGYGAIAKALRHRFDQLPIHKMCSDDQSSGHSSKIAIEKLKKAIDPSRARRFIRPCNSIKTVESGRQCDFLGMTPLHILATTSSNNSNNTKYDIELYQLLIKQYPENLITQDKCGDLPILYAFWADAPQEIIQLFIEQHQTLFSHHEMNWPGMVETIGRAHYLPGRGASAALKCIKNVLHTHQVAFPQHCVDWENVVTEWAKEDTSRTTERNVQKFHRDAFKYLVSFSISERVKALGVEKWRKQIQDDVNELGWFLCYRKKSTEMIYSKLARYEQLDQLREATSLLELALWKSSIDQDKEGCRDKAKVDVCRIRCGADIVVPNVLSFLLPA